MSGPGGSNSLGGSDRIDTNFERAESLGDESKIEIGRQLATIESEDPPPEQIANETKQPLESQERVEAYQAEKPSEQPSESQFAPYKSGRNLENMTRALGIGGKVIGGGGIVLGLLMGPPGLPFFLLGLGSLILGHNLIVRSETSKKENLELQRTEEPDIRDALNLQVLDLPPEVQKRVEQDLDEGKKPIMIIKFEVLKEIIQNDSTIEENVKNKMISQFAGKKVEKREYQQMMDRYILERERVKGEDPDYFIELLLKMGTKEQKETIIERLEQNKDDAVIWKDIKEQGDLVIQTTLQTNVLGRLLGFRG